MKMATKWNWIKHLILKNDAQIKIDAWSPTMGAKGVI